MTEQDWNDLAELQAELQRALSAKDTEAIIAVGRALIEIAEDEPIEVVPILLTPMQRINQVMGECQSPQDPCFDYQNYQNESMEAKQDRWKRTMRPLKSDTEAQQHYRIGDNVLNSAKGKVEQITGFREGYIRIGGPWFSYSVARNLFGLGVDLD